VTAISVLASIYLQAVIAASMEDVELFLAPLTARSKIREVLRGLLATRQVHTISLGHAPLFYVAGTLPEFPDPPTLYASSSVQASAYFMHSEQYDEEIPEPVVAKPVISAAPAAPAAPRKPAEIHAPRPAAVRKPAASAKSPAARPHFSRPAAHSRDRKPAQSASGSHPARRPAADSRSTAARPSNGSHSSGNHSNGNGRAAERPSTGASATRSAKSSAPTWVKRNGHSNGAKPAAKSGVVSRTGSSASRKISRPAARPTHSVGGHKPAVTASAKAGNNKRYGFTARPKQGTKKRG
jgi:hypothetical protein